MINDLRIMIYDFLNFKLSITDPYLHFIAGLRQAGYNTTVVFSRHNGVTARQNRIWIQGLNPALHSSDVRRLQLNMMQ